MRKRLSGIDGLRAIGCVVIVIYHYGQHFAAYLGG